jgi:hypothetical protein
VTKEQKEKIVKARQIVNSHFNLYYNCTIDDVDILDTPGYWRRKQPCGGVGKCYCQIHGFMFNEAPMRHTVTYFDKPYDYQTHRFTSPYATWRLLKLVEAQK